MNWFENTQGLDKAKELYRELLKQHHPDHGGDDATCRQIIEQFERFCQGYMQGKFDQYTTDTGNQTFGADVHMFAAKLAEVCKLNVTIEVIGYWIYVTDCFDVTYELKDMGFWFSKKHKARVYNGRGKVNIKSRYTTDDIRARHGSTHVKDKEEQEAIE